MLYLAYGSNLHPGRLALRAPSARLAGVFELMGWQLQFHKRGRDDSAKCDIVRTTGSVWAALFEIDGQGRDALDEIEGVGIGYRRVTLDLPRVGRVFTYRATAAHIDPGLKPFRWYKELVVAGCLFHGFPRSYVEQIVDVTHIDDHDTDRHDHHMQLANGLNGGPVGDGG